MTRSKPLQKDRKPAITKSSKTSKERRIVIIDDHPLIRWGLERLINSRDHLVVCGEAGNAADGMTVIRKTKPDLVVIDVGLPGANGIELTKQLVREFPQLRILIISMHDESNYASRAFRAGASGYMAKHEAIEKIEAAVHEVLSGRHYFSPAISGELSKSASSENLVNQLTDRELEVLERIGKGQEVNAIAEALYLSPKTVETHRTHIKEKLNLRNAHEVARFAVQWVGACGL
jgi:DNA-binding NarL/FixJ family response regulator